MELNIRFLSKTYPEGTKALQGINLNIGAGVFGLLGPNGAGKSTLMQILAGLTKADAGNVTFNGIDVLADPAAIKPQLGYLPQDFGLYPHLTAKEFLLHLAALHGIKGGNNRRAHVNHLLELVNLHLYRNTRLKAFSGGMRRRLGLAQALVSNPSLIIIDEPTAGLDPAERNRLHNLLGELAQEATIILSTHIVDDVRNLCTEMAIMADGKVLATGAPTELIDNLVGKVWRVVIEKEQLTDYMMDYRVLSRNLSGGQIVLHVYSATQPGPRFEPLVPSLEDAYFLTLHDREHHTRPKFVESVMTSKPYKLALWN